MAEEQDPSPLHAANGNGFYRPIPAFSAWFTGQLDVSDFDRYESLFAKTKHDATPQSLEAALNVATRYAAIDTGAIEGLYSVDRGFTRTVATQAASWEAIVSARGSHVRNAIEDALGAYEMVLDAATKSVPVSQAWIRELHARVCASQDTYTVYTEIGPQEHALPKGEYKSLPNSPALPDGRIHHYAPVLDTAPEMSRFVDELRSEAFLQAHPILQAAYAHYAYVCIHPFADGNGRVARALASIYLYRSPGVPLVVFADQKTEYLDALEAADLGDPARLIAFVGTRVVDAIGIMREILRRQGKSTEQSISAISELYAMGKNFEELAAAAARLKVLAAAEVDKQAARLTLPPQLQIQGSGNKVVDISPPQNYGSAGDAGALYFVIQGSWPFQVRVLNPMQVSVRLDDGASSDLVLHSTRDDGLEVMLREVTPIVTETLKLKLASWVEGQFEFALEEVAKQARAGG